MAINVIQPIHRTNKTGEKKSSQSGTRLMDKSNPVLMELTVVYCSSFCISRCNLFHKFAA